MCKNNCNCISDILKVIYLLQKNADQEEDCILSSDKPSLGQFSCLYYNTRPVMLYTCSCNGTAWSMPVSKDEGETTTSNVFRVEKVDGNCATFRVLVPNTDEDADCPYLATNSFFTMDLDCCCALRCLNDTYIECI